MGITPQKKGITIGFDCQFEVQLKDSRLSTILADGIGVRGRLYYRRPYGSRSQGKEKPVAPRYQIPEGACRREEAEEIYLCEF